MIVHIWLPLTDPTTATVTLTPDDDTSSLASVHWNAHADDVYEDSSEDGDVHNLVHQIYVYKQLTMNVILYQL